MDSSHILLGRPWQSDRHTHHDGMMNTYTISWKGKKFLLQPLSPKEVVEDHIKMKLNIGKERLTLSEKHREKKKNKKRKSISSPMREYKGVLGAYGGSLERKQECLLI